MRPLVLGALLALVFIGSVRIVSAQGKTVWDGVFSSEQAIRGETLFATHWGQTPVTSRLKGLIRLVYGGLTLSFPLQCDPGAWP